MDFGLLAKIKTTRTAFNITATIPIVMSHMLTINLNLILQP
jgi:hypothetical protein